VGVPVTIDSATLRARREVTLAVETGCRPRVRGTRVVGEIARPEPEPESTQLTPAPQPKTVDLATLEPQDLAVARELAANIDANEVRCVLAFGTKPQDALASATKTIIGTSTDSAADEARATLTELLQALREADTDSASGAIEKFVRKIPVIGGRFSEARQIMGAYEPIADKITKIEAKLREQQMTLLTDYESLNKMFAENADFIEQLKIFISAGQLKLDELKQQFQSMQSGPEPASDHFNLQAYDDCRRAIDRLSQRIYDLELTRMIALQTGPQIRLIQDGDERLATKIHTAVLTTIPLWKGQVAMAISLAHQKEALENVKDFTDTTNELLLTNSEVLKQGTLDVRRETERGIVDIDTLRATTDNLISTVEEALRISAEGRAKRVEGEMQIAETEERIKSMLAEKQREIAGF
jgi:uncharacterized protein YaaN involved in tellurite resistance